MARDRDDYTDEPPRRRRRDDDDYDDDDRPRGGRRRDEDDEDEDDRPRRRRRRDEDDYDEDRPARHRELSGMDGLFANTNIVLLVLFACLCNGIALILGIIGLATCTDPRAKQNALITTIIGGIVTFLGVGANILSILASR
jgi:hypothetical protein